MELSEEQEKLYLKANARRWKLAEYLIKVLGFVLVPLYPFFHKDETKRGKVPYIKWKDRTETTMRDLQDWRGKYDGFSNLGLLLGLKSGGILGIDVDGLGGREILKELSGGDLPLTVAYETPGNGLRYLYRYPDEYIDTMFQKQAVNGEGEHNAVEFLVDNQMTVLPYSIHPNGGVYRFLNDQSFKKVPIAVAPDWVMDILLKKGKTITPRKVIANTSSAPAPVKTASVEKLIADSRCSKLQELLEVQKSPDSLHYDLWFLVIAFLTAAGFSDAAREFSQLSHKHNKNSEKCLDKLAEKPNQGTVRCLTFGCSEDDVTQCFAKLHHNENGDLTNSPSSKLASGKEHKGSIDYEEIGLYIDEDGRLAHFNANKFIRHYLETNALRAFEGRRPQDSRYYIHEDNHWREISELNLKRSLRSLLDQYYPDAWTPYYDSQCMCVLPLACPKANELKPADNYINCRNGLINLTTFALEPHDRDIFSTTQLPIDYEKEAECPGFMAFLDDVFSGDQEVIALVQEIFGYALSPSTDAHKFFVWIGDGSNAKSVLAKILTNLAGERNVSRVSLQRFSERFGLASIVDKRLVIATENESKSRGLGAESLKAITAGEPIPIERKHEDPFDYTPNLKMIFLCNRPPKFTDWSGAMKRRMLIIPFKKQYVEDEPVFEYEGKINRHITDDLLKELPGILTWALEGWERLRGNDLKFTRSKKVNDYLKEYWLEHDHFEDFVTSCIISCAGGKIRLNDLYRCVRAFLDENGMSAYAKSLTSRTITREIESTLKAKRIYFYRKDSGRARPFYEVTLNKKAKEYLRSSCMYQ